MTRRVMVIDLERCLGCQSCTITCKIENATPPGVHFARVLKKEVGQYPDARRLVLPVLCMHCRKPACVDVCPTGASIQRADGIVYVDADQCMGCRYCMMACPYEARSFVGESKFYFGEPTPYEQVATAVLGKGVPAGTVGKCDFCRDRVDAGRLPACAESCPSKARIFGDLDDPNSEVSKLLRTREHFELRPDAGTEPCVYYLVQVTPQIVEKQLGRTGDGAGRAIIAGVPAIPVSRKG
jgi:molybdopterin-containing oxidoreductase family iron-sulfur binding subunit